MFGKLRVDGWGAISPNYSSTPSTPTPTPINITNLCINIDSITSNHFLKQMPTKHRISKYSDYIYIVVYNCKI